MTPDIRKGIKLATKLPPTSVHNREDMQSILDNQLRKLKTDHIDYYLLHGVDANSWVRFQRYDVFSFLDKQVRDGKVVNPGFSFHGPSELFPRIVDAYPWVFCQIQYNYLDERFQAGTGGLMYAAEKDLAVMIMEPLRGGTLTRNVPDAVMKIWKSANIERTPAQWALKWIYNRREVTVVLSGMNEEAHIDENIRTACESLADSMTPEELEIIESVRDRYRAMAAIPCTACHYCMPCPKGVNIPDNFDMYNRIKCFHDSRFMMRFTYMLHNNGLEKGATNYASNCVNCGKCVQACPQHIPIPEMLKLVQREFEGLPLRIFQAAGKMMYRRAR